MSSSPAPYPQATPAAPLKRGGRQVRYLAQSAMLEELGMSTMARLVVMVASALVIIFLVWSAFFRMEEVSVTFGSVVPRSSVHVVQHLEGGIVRDVLVEERELVSAGQVLAILDPVQATADAEQIEARRHGLEIRAERLRAMAEEREPDFSAVPLKYHGLVVDQLEILQATRDRKATQRRVLDGEIAQKQSEVNAARQQQRAVRRQLDLVAEEVEMRRTLHEQGHGSLVALNSVQREYAALESELGRLQGQENTAHEALGELNERIADLTANYRQDALNELGTVTAELAQVEESVVRATDRTTRLSIVSPINGIVQNLQVKTTGAVVPAGGLVMEIVPVDDELIVETRISTRDIGHLSVGQSVKVKFTTYDFVRYGSISGTLVSISATTYIDEADGQPYYRGRVTLDETHVMGPQGQQDVLPGMTVQADIITGEKTLLEYLLKPVHVSLAHAMRER